MARRQGRLSAGELVTQTNEHSNPCLIKQCSVLTRTQPWLLRVSDCDNGCGGHPTRLQKNSATSVPSAFATVSVRTVKRWRGGGRKREELEDKQSEEVCG